MFLCSSDLAFVFGSQFFLQIMVKNRVRIIHGRALYTGKYGNYDQFNHSCHIIGRGIPRVGLQKSPISKTAKTAI